MAKFAFVFIFALFALQGSKAINHSDLFRDGNDVKDLINELKQIITDVSSRGSKLIHALNEKFSEIETAADFPSLVDELQQNIKQVLAEGGAAADACDDDAWMRAAELETLAHVVSYRFQLDDEATDLRKQLQDLISKVQGLLMEVGKDVYKCMRESYGNYEKFTQCMEEKVASVKQELEVVDKAIQETFNMLEASVPMFTSKMSECVNDNKQELINKIKVLIEDVKLCIKTNSVMLIGSHKRGSSHIINVSDNINDIMAKHNVKALIAELKEDIEKMLATSEKDERLCGTKAHELVKMLSRNSQAEAELCVATMGLTILNPRDVLKELDLCLTRVEDRISAQGQVIVGGLNQCFKNVEMLY